MGFVLGWHFVAMRLIAGLVMVIGVATLVQNLVKDDVQQTAPVDLSLPEPEGHFLPAGERRCGFLEHHPGLYPGGSGTGRGARLAVPACRWCE
jgi:uncharacterized membrane protein YraQ (UPF0718 family)